MSSLEVAREIVRSCLQLGELADSFDRDSGLLGVIPDFNSLSIVSIITAIEEELDCEVADDEISGEVFETLGTLADFIEQHD